jgi:hypothetical protein
VIMIAIMTTFLYDVDDRDDNDEDFANGWLQQQWW